MESKPLNKHSSIITQDKSQGGGQAMLYGTGMKDADMQKAQIGVGSMWFESNTCNMHLLELAKHVKKSINQNKNLIGFCFNTIGVSDGITNGTVGMNYSLQSRDLIADSVETIVTAHCYDGSVLIPGCDKNMPGCMIALGRMQRPGFIIYGGSIKPGCANIAGKKQQLDIVSAFQTYGQYLTNQINNSQRQNIVRNACPGAGACGGMFTANTMSSAIEAMGLSLPYSASNPAVSKEKQQECAQAGEIIENLLRLDLTPKDIMTKAAFENAITIITVLGGSTNAVLHLIAVAKSVGVKLTLDDFQRISTKTPYLADMRPSGKYFMHDLHLSGGIPGVMKFLLRHNMIDGSCITITGKTIKENLENLPGLKKDQKIIRPLNNPIKPAGHIQILYGNLAPEGGVAKITGKEGEKFRGPAKVFDSEQLMAQAVEKNQITAGDVIVIRYAGPKGGPGMPEMLKPTSMLVGAGLGDKVALITDGRFSGGSHGFIIGHICPEAQTGGPIALIKNNDIINIDITKNLISLEISDTELNTRKQQWQAPEYKAKSGTLYKYIKNVSSASDGCVTDE